MKNYINVFPIKFFNERVAPIPTQKKKNQKTELVLRTLSICTRICYSSAATLDNTIIKTEQYVVSDLCYALILLKRDFSINSAIICSRKQ